MQDLKLKAVVMESGVSTTTASFIPLFFTFVVYSFSRQFLRIFIRIFQLFYGKLKTVLGSLHPPEI